ncbi:protocadherin-11 X-linked-like [Ruditapes philippinarum]|uniref:protocadherin-11 X-linked-like n=1 Tax=Ruditapes philippinarum TaxID=129788 RepID=UPI00295B03ED|nr:protocadherin-11 X-linked-like [Ruditapes philippinarum]XP_060583346.1 protocadherin-11 X-linked-like [Ruditapes philippinarum]XP_060583347.1 protocadherin-11 X-linked-like [Ruditapes philippinarum]XP_060583348.1 protocadherin-11 X-linked-like [Ruditapes philippinarum]XP_060583349.1 protocadherin-11 X-linked-like [Ruditapes philippinarum]
MACFAIIFITFIIPSFIIVNAAENPMIKFTIEEELPSGRRVGNIADESKSFINHTTSILLYTFLPPTDASMLFSINDDSGDIFTSVVIDRESVCEYDVICKIVFDVAVKSKDNDYFQIVTVQVFIEDKNDNSPMFSMDVYHLNITEGTSSGSYNILPAVDKDLGGNNSIQSYHLLLSQESQGYFELIVSKNHVGTFMLKLVLQKVLDREQKETYTLEIVAKDGGSTPNTGTLKVVVHVLDINDNTPEFTKTVYNVSIKENLAVMETVLTLQANDSDLGENGRVTYRIGEFQKDRDVLDEYFIIDETSGELKVKSDLSTVAGQTYRFIVEAVDHGAVPLFSQAEVEIHIEDYGNNAPMVSISFISPGNTGFVNISENAKNTSFVAHVNVEDQDSGLNGEVNCEISNSHFSVVPMDKGFKVVVNAILDREVLNAYNLTVICYDKGTPVMSGSTHFIVRISDYNDNRPSFVQPKYNAKLTENNKGNEELMKVSATDPDEGRNAIIHYTMHEDAMGRFIVDSNTGVVKVNAIFDREKEPIVIFRVLAIDDGVPTSLTGTATVTLTLTDMNDNPPMFNKTVHGFKIPENQPTGTDVAMLKAFDLDDGVNAEFDFSIESEYLDNVPFVLFSDGLLKANKQLDREEKSRYDFVVVVTDHGEVQQSSMAHVTIVVEDTNDNRPIVTFPKPTNKSVTAMYPDFISEYITTIEAYDLDDGINKDLQYSIRAGNELGIFKINKDTGALHFADQIDIGSNREMRLDIAVSDKGEPPLETVTNLEINLQYTNATFLGPDDASSNSKYIIISVAVVIVTLVISGAIIAVILVLRTLDRKRKMKEADDSTNTIDSDFGFSQVTQNHTILSADTLSSGSGEGQDLIKKKEVSFVLDNNDSFSYHQQYQMGNTSMSSNDKPSKSSLRYSTHTDLSHGTFHSQDFQSEAGTQQQPMKMQQNVLDTRELQNEANAQLQTIKLQQIMLQSRAKQWVQQQQQYGAIVHEDHHSDGSGETIGSDSGRGCSEEDDVFSTPSADDPKLFEISSPESQHSYHNVQLDSYNQPASSYIKQPWTRKPHLAHKDYKSSHSHLALNRNLNIQRSVNLDQIPSLYNNMSQNRSSFGSAYYGGLGPMDYTGDSALHSFFDKTPVVMLHRDDDDNCSTTTSGSYTIQSEEIL